MTPLQINSVPKIALPNTLAPADPAQKHWILIVNRVDDAFQWDRKKNPFVGNFTSPGTMIREPFRFYYVTDPLLLQYDPSGVCIEGTDDIKRAWNYAPEVGDPWLLLAESKRPTPWTRELYPYILGALQSSTEAAKRRLEEIQAARLDNSLKNVSRPPGWMVKCFLCMADFVIYSRPLDNPVCAECVAKRALTFGEATASCIVCGERLRGGRESPYWYGGIIPGLRCRLCAMADRRSKGESIAGMQMISNIKQSCKEDEPEKPIRKFKPQEE